MYYAKFSEACTPRDDKVEIEFANGECHISIHDINCCIEHEAVLAMRYNMWLMFSTRTDKPKHTIKLDATSEVMSHFQ